MANRTMLCRYHYDPLDRLASRTPLAQAAARQFYNDAQLATELQGNAQRSFFRTENRLLAQQSQTGSELGITLMATDLQGSVLNCMAPVTHDPIAYSAYGYRSIANPLPGLPGLNGEQSDPQTGHYLLGNGYRAFNPVLMRFNSPDSLSPLSGGGLNPYAYCLGDPVNRIDPTGHLSWQAQLGLGFGLLGIGLSIFSLGAATPLAIAGLASGLVSGGAGVAQAVTEKSSPEASSILGWVSLGSGLASVGFGGAASVLGNTVRSRALSQAYVSQRGERLAQTFGREMSERAVGAAASQPRTLKELALSAVVNNKLPANTLAPPLQRDVQRLLFKSGPMQRINDLNPVYHSHLSSDFASKQVRLNFEKVLSAARLRQAGFRHEHHIEPGRGLRELIVQDLRSS